MEVFAQGNDTYSYNWLKICLNRPFNLHTDRCNMQKVFKCFGHWLLKIYAILRILFIRNFPPCHEGCLQLSLEHTVNMLDYFYNSKFNGEKMCSTSFSLPFWLITEWKQIKLVYFFCHLDKTKFSNYDIKDTVNWQVFFFFFSFPINGIMPKAS